MSDSKTESGKPVYTFSRIEADYMARGHYIFSLPENLARYRSISKEYATMMFGKAIEASNSQWDAHIKEIEFLEKIKASVVAKELNITEGDPKEEVLKYFNDQIQTSPGVHDDALDMEFVIFSMFEEQIRKAYKDGVDFDNIFKNSIARYNKLSKRVSEDLIKIYKENTLKILKQDNLTLNEYHKTVRDVVVNKMNISNEALARLLKVQKGNLQEVFILNLADSLGSAKMVGTELTEENLKEYLNERMSNILTSKGVNFSPGQRDSKIHTDVIFETKGGVQLGISIKTTVDRSPYQIIYRISHHIQDPFILGRAKSIKIGSFELDYLVKVAAVSILSDFLMRGKIYGSDQLLRPLGYLMLHESQFVETIYNPKNMTRGDFHYLLNINNRFYWYSDFVKSLIKEISDFDGAAYKNSIFQITGLDNLSFTSEELLRRKRWVRRQEIKTKKNYDYASRVKGMLEDTVLKKWFLEGERAFDSAAMRINGAKFRVLRHEPEMAKRGPRKK